ncbi:hypothetical protein ACFSRY_11830 [Pontibacter locisalis]|uniref:YcxB-like protein domain-containing protein n=1 Tax=Pontibacter locisalis TaxID=1719035 RepID=A0ABW5ING3_9BACT
MQELSIKLYTGAYDIKPKAEQRLKWLSAFAVTFQLVLVFYLVFFETFSAGVVVVFLINVTIPAYFLYSAWLDNKPHYRRHLTLTEEGVKYRTRFMQTEQEFDWDEVDLVRLQSLKVVFLLKNEEEHVVSLEQIQNDQVLKQVRERIKSMVIRKDIVLS